jgi:TPR repeat protein
MRSFICLLLAPVVWAVDGIVIPEYREAELGKAEAQVHVGNYYVNMFVKTQIANNLTEAADWYRKAAKQRNPEGMTLLAKLYLRPEPEVHNVAEAFHWFNELYEQNHIISACNYELGRMYVTGTYAEPAGKPEYFKGYYHLLIQRATGIEFDSMRVMENTALRNLSASQIKDAKDRAFRWVEDHNKPRLSVEEQVAIATGNNNAYISRTNNDNKNDKNDTSPTAKEKAVDTSDKALDLARKNAQENARTIRPLGKTQKYELPTTDPKDYRN